MTDVIEFLLGEAAKNRTGDDLLEAFTVIVEILSLDPVNLPAQLEWIGLFDGLAVETMPEVSAAWARQLAGTAPGWVLQGLLEGSSTDAAHDRTLEDYVEAIRLDPDSLLASYYRGNYYFSYDQFSEAANDFTRCLEIAPDFLQALYDRADVYGAMEDYEAAIEDLLEYQRRTGGNQLWVGLQIVEYLSRMDEDDE